METIISIILSNTLVISAWWCGVLIKKNSEIEDELQN